MINILLDNNFKINIERNNDYMKNISKIMVTALSCFMIAIPITNNIYADEENTSTEYQSLQVGDSYSVIEDIDALGFPADYDDFVDKIKEIKDFTGNEYFPPLEENTVYNNLKIVYFKKVLGKEVNYREELEFKRIDSMTVEIQEKNGGVVFN